MPDSPITNFKDSNNVDLGRKLVTKDYLLEVYGTILENSPASGLVVTPELWGWGRGNDGALGNNALFQQRPTPVTTFAGGTNWKQVSGGYNYTAAIKTDGTLWTFGQGADPFNGSVLRGKLGVNDADGRAIPVTTFAGGTNWNQVSAGSHHTAAIKTDGSLWIWGANNNGQLGINNATLTLTPVTTFAGGNTWKSVTCGEYHTAAIKTDGTLWVWGASGGTNGAPNRSTPVTTFAGGTTWKQVSAGTNHTAAIKTDGTLWGWGGNGGKLGDNTTTDRGTPVPTFAGGTTWKQVSAGNGLTAAIKTDGTLWVWGGNGYGQLGTNNNITRSTPVTTFAGGNNWKQVDVGAITAAIKTDGTLWVWGHNGTNNLAFLGINDTSNTTRSTPVTTFAGGNNWKQVSGLSQHTVAIQTIDYI